MQVRRLVAPHIVRFTRIDEEVGLCAVMDTLLQERERMLWEHNGVVQANNYLQTAF